MHPVLREFKFSIEKTPENEEMLKSLGYQKRNGSLAPERPYLAVLPLKLWYWEQPFPCVVNARVEDVVTTQSVLRIEQREV